MIVKKAENSQVESCPARAMLEAEGYQGALSDILKERKKQGNRRKKK
jgi:hypothetical protein